MSDQVEGELVLTAYARLHITLLNLGDPSLRQYGGVGLSLDLPAATIIWKPATALASGVMLDATQIVEPRTRSDLEAAIGRMVAIRPEARGRVDVLQVVPAHTGLGSKTGTVLGTLALIDAANNLRLTRGQLQSLSGRGGTSGIGVNGFFTGGLITDAGHDPALDAYYGPSSAGMPSKVPQVVVRADVPSSWRFHLLLTPGHGLSGGNERAFFRTHTPLSTREVHEITAVTYLALVPAILAADLVAARSALARVHQIGFKKRELESQPPKTQELLGRVERLPGCAAGLSSMGPLVYAITHEDNCIDDERAIKSVCDDVGAAIISTTRGRNTGYSLEQFYDPAPTQPRGD